MNNTTIKGNNDETANLLRQMEMYKLEIEEEERISAIISLQHAVLMSKHI
jgi:hypothetical protein